MVVALLYAMQSPCNCFTLSLNGTDSHKSNKLGRLQRYYGGDQGVAPVTMVIMMVLWRWRSKAQDDDGHIISLISPTTHLCSTRAQHQRIKPRLGCHFGERSNFKKNPTIMQDLSM